MTVQIDAKIRSFVDAGKESLAAHPFVSEQLNALRGKQRAPAFRGAEASKDVEESVRFRMNQTGNIFYATTSQEVQQETKRLFDSVTVLFAAMTKALHDKGKSLFDYGAWVNVIGSSGYFVEVQKFQKTLSIETSSLTVNTQVIQQLLPGLASGQSMEIAKGVLSALNGTYSAQNVNEATKFGHLLFICEELFGAASVTVRLFYASKQSHQKMTSSPCHKTVSQSFEQQQEGNTFLFVSPETIAKLAGDFNTQPQAYLDLVAKLSAYIK